MPLRQEDDLRALSSDAIKNPYCIRTNLELVRR